MDMDKLKAFSDLSDELRENALETLWQYIKSHSENPYDTIGQAQHYCNHALRREEWEWRDWATNKLTKKARAYCREACANCSKQSQGGDTND